MTETKLYESQKTLFSKVTVVKEVSHYDVQSLLVGLFENGYSPWLNEVSNMTYAEGLKKEDFQKDGKMQDPNCYFHPFQLVPTTEGCAVILKVDDPETEGKTKRFTMNKQAIEKGLQVMATDYPSHWNDFISENDDAITSDVFGQCIVYGEVIYG